VVAKYGLQEWCVVVECRSSQAKVKFKGTSEFLVPRAAEWVVYVLRRYLRLDP
jgi:hypothetical protein